MNDTPHDDGSPTLAGEIDELPRDIAPPRELEERVVRALGQRGLIEPGGDGARWRVAGRRALALAASVALVAIGFVAGRVSIGSPDGMGVAVPPGPGNDAGRPPGAALADGRPIFGLMLYEGAEFQRAGPGEELAVYGEYGTWIAGVGSDGRFVGGEALDYSGWVLTPTAEGMAVEQGLAMPADEILTGFFLIAADDSAEAIAIASEMPHLRYGGRVVVRPIMATDTPPVEEEANAAQR